MPFLRHPKTGVTLFVGQKSFDEHQAKEKSLATKEGQRKLAAAKKAKNAR